MIEMDESENLESAVSIKVLRLVAAFCGSEVANRLLYPKEHQWSYDQIMQSGSPDLVEVVFLITGGIAPGGRDNEKVIVPTLSNPARNDHRYSS